MKLKQYKHANIDTMIVVDLDQVFTYYYSPGHKATLLLATGGAMIPISESVEQVTNDRKQEKQ